MRISHVISFIVGGVAGSLVTAKFLKQKYQNKADTEIAEMEQYYKEKLEKQEKTHAEPTTKEKDLEKQVAEKDLALQELRKSFSQRDSSIATHYRKSYGSETLTEEPYEDADQIDICETIKDDEPAEPPIHFVDLDTYLDHDDGYGEVALIYYQGDAVLTEEEVPITNQKAIIGDLRLGVNDRDERIVYVKNNVYKSYYEILLTPENYQDDDTED